MAIIKLTRGKECIVDDDLYNIVLKHYKWYYGSDGYAIRRVGNNFCKMHRSIMNPPPGYEVDHINGNTLDNRLCNLRICTNIENHRNKGHKKNSKHNFKGICLDKNNNKWKATIRVDNKNKHLGYFINKEDAARAYNEAAKKYYGEFARLNKGV